MKNFLTETFKWAYQKSNGVTAKESYSVTGFLPDGRMARIYTSFALLRSDVENAITKPRCQLRRWMSWSLRSHIIICNIFRLAGSYKRTLLRVLHAKNLTK
jgi:hypothetical protein